MTAWRIRPGVAADVPAIEQLIRDAYAKYVPRIDREPAPMVDDYALRVRDGRAWVADEAGTIIGVLILLPARDHLLLYTIGVAPDRQGGGIGRALIRFTEEEARRRELPEVRLFTHEKMHENVAMYPRLGYEETGRERQAGHTRVLFRKRL